MLYVFGVLQNHLKRYFQDNELDIKRIKLENVPKHFAHPEYRISVDDLL